MPNDLEAGVMIPRSDGLNNYKFIYNKKNNEKVNLKSFINFNLLKFLVFRAFTTTIF